MVIDRGWNLVDANAGIALFTRGAADELLAPPVNVLRLSLHPEGLASRIANLGEWRALAELAIESFYPADPATAAALRSLTQR